MGFSSAPDFVVHKCHRIFCTCPILKIDGFLGTHADEAPAICAFLRLRALLRRGATGAAAPVNFGQQVHAPVNFQT